MLGPSGFFLPTGPESTDQDTRDIELIHTSEEGFSELYRICKNGRFFVYKALKKEFRGNRIYEELLTKDFNIGFSLNHSGICQYFGKITHPEIGSCIVMEWVDGCTLEELIASGQIDRTLGRKIICEICDALEYMHRKQIIHRDLKPENILITHNGQNVKLIDFGLSDADSYDTFKAPAGTRMYASPELIAGEHIDNRSDIWSLGVIISEIHPYYRNVAGRCLIRDLAKRPASAEDVKRAVLKEGGRKFWKAVLWVMACAIMAALAAVITVKTLKLHGPVQTPENLTISEQEPEQTDISSDSGPKTTPESAKDTNESDNQNVTEDTSKTRPAARSNDLPPAENLDADELEALFKDAAKSIL